MVNEVEKGVWPANLWKEIEEMGLPLIAVPEDKNGVGGTLADMLALLRLADNADLDNLVRLVGTEATDIRAIVECAPQSGQSERSS